MAKEHYKAEMLEWQKAAYAALGLADENFIADIALSPEAAFNRILAERRDRIDRDGEHYSTLVALVEIVRDGLRQDPATGDYRLSPVFLNSERSWIEAFTRVRSGT